MRQNQYIFVTLLYIIIVFFISQIVTYNVILTNPDRKSVV